MSGMNETAVKAAIALMAILTGLIACCRFNSCVARAQKQIKTVAPISHGTPKETKQYATKSEFDSHIRKGGFAYLLFSGEYCVPCHKLSKLLVDAEVGNHKDLITVNTEQTWVKKLVKLYNVGSTPTIVIFKDGHWTGEMRIGFNNCLIFLLANLK